MNIYKRFRFFIWMYRRSCWYFDLSTKLEVARFALRAAISSAAEWPITPLKKEAQEFKGFEDLICTGPHDEQWEPFMKEQTDAILRR